MRSITTRSPLGALIQELREERTAGRGWGVRGEPSSARRGGREPELRVETRVVSDPVAGAATSRLLPVSLVLHAALLAAVVVVPLLTSDAPPVPTRALRTVFVAPALAAPPPPAAPRLPPTARVAAGAHRHASAPAAGVPAPVVPVEAADLPVSLAAEHGDTVDEAGEADGVEAGIPGGVVGGIVGGIPAPPPPPPAEPVRVGGEVKEPAKLKHVSPVYPDIAVAANVQGAVVLECTVSPLGRVTAVTVVRGIPLLNQPAVDAVRQWLYTPTLKDGVPVPVVLTVTVQFRLQDRRRS